MLEANDFKALKIGIASPEKIRSWSYGEVLKPETINYRTLKPERDGLFCEKIFGPTRDYECSCGKYKRLRYKNIVCDRCGVEVTKSSVRRERMGHIELATPVSHIWYVKGVPSYIGLTLDMSPRDLEEVIYFVSYVVLDPGATTLIKKQTLSDKEYRAYYEKYGNTFRVGMGAEAIKELLSEVDVNKELEEIQKELDGATGQKRTRLVKRLDVINSFVQSGNKPEWMIIEALPVIPPELRPMIQLDGGRFATSDLNDLYRRVINRNNRLKKLIELGAPSIIIQNEKRMLQEAVDSLFDNGRRGRSVTGAGNRALKSLSSMLKSKQGRFRQNLLGKRVDYSGRSVIVVGPDLKMYQCGIPKEMALELFKPHVIHGLTERGLANNIKSAKKMIDNQDPKVWDIVEDVIKEHPVMLNRAPTLHRLGIQAFEPKLISGKAIRLHPLVCTAFNADFDGDQMAVHVPLSEEAKTEARILMLGSNNILSPKNGDPIVTPSQDMILGNYYITMEKAGVEGEGRAFKNTNEALMAYQRREITLQTRIVVPVNSFKHKVFLDEDKNKYLVTTPGKIIFNEILPDSFPYLCEATSENIEGITPSKYFIDYGEDVKARISEMPLSTPFNKGALEKIIAQMFKRYKTTETSIFLDKLKDLGFKYSTFSGITIAVSDVVTSKNKDAIIEKSNEEIKKVNKQFQRGLITDRERLNHVIEIWTKAKEEIQDELQVYAKEYVDNPIFIMMNSKARGSISNFVQLAGMRGLMLKPNGETIEIPILSSFSDGLSVSEFFLSTHSARKGSADTALKTADSGYMTRRLVDVAQDIIVKEEDCGTIQGVVVSAFMDDKDGIIEPLYDRIVGRYTNKKVINPETKEVIIDKNEFITEAIADKIIKAGITEVEIRNVLTCKTDHGVCQHCYGRNLATGNLVEIGEAVGIMGAQSIGEPGTQLTMRTFHTGGVAGDDITQGLPRVEELFEARKPKGLAIIAEFGGKVQLRDNKKKREVVITNDETGESKAYLIPYGSRIKVLDDQVLEAGDELTEGSVNPHDILKIKGIRAVQDYMLREVQRVYRLQGVDINDKHIEIIVRQMLKKIRIEDNGDSSYLPGTLVDVLDFEDTNEQLIAEGKQPAEGSQVMLGITKASLATDSFMSAASFQETTKVLTDAAIKSKVDPLNGLKENVIIGKLIPAGTGMKRYRSVKLDTEMDEINFFDDDDEIDFGDDLESTELEDAVDTDADAEDEAEENASDLETVEAETSDNE